MILFVVEYISCYQELIIGSYLQLTIDYLWCGIAVQEPLYIYHQ